MSVPAPPPQDELEALIPEARARQRAARARRVLRSVVARPTAIRVAGRRVIITARPKPEGVRRKSATIHID